CPGMATDRRGNCLAVFVLSLLPDVSGKLVPLARRARARGSRANGGDYRAVSLRATSNVRRSSVIYVGYTALAWFLVRGAGGVRPDRSDGAARRDGRADITGGTSGLRCLHYAGEISLCPACVVTPPLCLRRGGRGVRLAEQRLQSIHQTIRVVLG